MLIIIILCSSTFYNILYTVHTIDIYVMMELLHINYVDDILSCIMHHVERRTIIYYYSYKLIERDKLEFMKRHIISCNFIIALLSHSLLFASDHTKVYDRTMVIWTYNFISCKAFIFPFKHHICPIRTIYVFKEFIMRSEIRCDLMIK